MRSRRDKYAPAWLPSTPRPDELPRCFFTRGTGAACGTVSLRCAGCFSERWTGYTDTIVTYCESLATFPHRGVPRDEVRPGLRITHYLKRAVIAFDVDGDQIFILGMFYGGQDYEAILQDGIEQGLP